MLIGLIYLIQGTYCPMNKLFKAESFISLLVALTLFLILLLSFSQWQNQYNQRSAKLFQKQQALRIAENQLALKMAGEQCEAQLQQNRILFTIQCNQTEINVRFPLGEYRLSW